MYHGIDAVGVDMQPIKNSNEIQFIYFISFILIVAFFVLNMFVGVVVENFHNCRAEQELEEEVANKLKHEKMLRRTQRLMSDFPYYDNFPLWRKYLHKICINKYFDLIIALIIGLNIITMSLEHYQMSSVKYILSIFLSNI